jgi:hypothetical protein
MRGDEFAAGKSLITAISSNPEAHRVGSADARH